MPAPLVFLANRGNLTRRQLYGDVNHRLTKEPGCDATYYEPSRVRPRTVVAEVEPDVFFERQYAASTARLEVEFWFPSEKEYEFYKIEWIEPDRNLGVGWHQDLTHPSLGNCHFQIDHERSTVCRDSARFIDEHPLNVLESRLAQFRALVPVLDWGGSTPSLPNGGVPDPP